MSDHDDLATYQRRLLQALHGSGDGNAIANILRGDPALATFVAGLERCEPRCLEVAAELAKRWGARAPEGET